MEKVEMFEDWSLFIPLKFLSRWILLELVP